MNSITQANNCNTVKSVIKVNTYDCITFSHKYNFYKLIPLYTNPDRCEGKIPEKGASVKDQKWNHYNWLSNDKTRILPQNDNKNIGIVIPDDKIVIDIDNCSKNKGGNGVKYFLNILQTYTNYSSIEDYCKHERIPYTKTPSEGFHIYFAYNYEMNINKTFSGCDSIDIKKKGEYIVCPYSVYMGCHGKYKENGDINDKPHKCGKDNLTCLYRGKIYEPFWPNIPDVTKMSETEIMNIQPFFKDCPFWILQECVKLIEPMDYIKYNENSKFKTDEIYDDRVEKFAQLCDPIWNGGSYNNWIVLIWTIKSLLGENGRQLVHNLSSKDPEYTEKQTNFIFDSGKNGYFTLGTLRYYANLCNSFEYEKVCKELYKRDKSYIEKKNKDNLIKEASVIDDDYASKVFINLIGSKLKKHEGNLYFFDEHTGLWERNDNKHTSYFKAITKYKEQLIFNIHDLEGNVILTINYGGIKRKAIDMLSYINSAIPETNFLDNIDTSIGKLLFLDGMYDFKTNTFTPGFNENIIFLNRITRNFPKERNDRNIKYVYDTLFQKPFDKSDDSVKAGDYLLQSITIGIYGDYTIKKFIFSVGEGNSGKGMLVTALKGAFGKYIGEFDGNQLLIKDGSNDCAKELGWLVFLEGKRIAFSNECKMDTKGIDGNTIKKIASGGDSHEVRLLYENQREIVCKSLLFFLCNDIPKISPWDSGVDERVKITSYTRQFLSYDECVKNDEGSIDESTGISLKDENIKNEFKNNTEIQDALFHLIVDTFQKIYKPRVLNNVKQVWNIETPECVKQATKERKLENKGGCNSLKEALELRFEFTNNKEDKVTFESLETHLKDNGYRNYSATKLSLEIQKLLPNDWTDNEKRKKARLIINEKSQSKNCIFGLKEID